MCKFESQKKMFIALVFPATMENKVTIVTIVVMDDRLRHAVITT